jgi:hypothetical protein
MLSAILGLDGKNGEADQPAPNRAQHRAQQKFEAGQKRRANKSHQRNTLAQRKAQVEARRELVRQGSGFHAVWAGRRQVFCALGTAMFEGKRIPVVAVDSDNGLYYFDDRFGKVTKMLQAPDSMPRLPEPITIDLDTFRTRTLSKEK